jgi:hypothetical protein
MRTLNVVPLVLALLGLAAAPAFAQSEDEKILQEGTSPEQGEQSQSAPRQSKADDDMDDEELDERVFYSGFGVERVSTDFDNLGAATNLEGVLGFRIPTAPWLGLEIDLGQTMIPGEYRDPDPGAPACTDPPFNTTPLGCVPGGRAADNGAYDGAGDEFMMQALGLSLALKSNGPFYVTGKYGYRYIATSNDTVNENRSGKGFAFGVGYRWGRGLSGVELGYKQLAEDVESIGLTFFVRSARR